MAPAVVHQSSSVAQTEAIAASLVERLSRGGVVGLEGGLGAGKTQFVRGLVSALGGDRQQVHSPTFILLHEYAISNGRRLFHLDAYRIGSDDLEAIGFEELLAAVHEGDVIAIEWPQNVAELMPVDAIRIQITADSPTRRTIHIS